MFNVCAKVLGRCLCDTKRVRPLDTRAESKDSNGSRETLNPTNRTAKQLHPRPQPVHQCQCGVMTIDELICIVLEIRLLWRGNGPGLLRGTVTTKRRGIGEEYGRIQNRSKKTVSL